MRTRASRGAHRPHIRRAALAFAGVLACVASARGEDLSKRYKATLDAKEPIRPVEWTSTERDVWTLARFELDRGDKLTLELGKATAVFGVAGTDAVWAVVVPAKPVELRSSLAAKGEQVGSVLLRFNPHRIGDLFPAKSVGKQGPLEALLFARRRVAHHLTETGYRAHVLPLVQKRGQLVVDCEMQGGARRVFYVDTEVGTVELDQRLTRCEWPAPVEMDGATAVEAFDKSWKEFDRIYAKFQLRPEVDWDSLYKRYRALAAESRSSWQAAMSIALLLEHLRDLHVHVKCGDEFMPQALRWRPQNGSLAAVPSLVGELHEISDDVKWARTKDGVGYLFVGSVGSEEITRAVDTALEQLGDTWSLVLDLRFNGGGGTDIAAAVAGRFVDEESVYAYSQRRVSSKRTQLGDKNPRSFAPRGPWRYAGPVAVLLGQRCMSSGEELALMLEQCAQATSFGDRTAGSSAAPKPLELEGGIYVNVPTWNDLDADGKPYEDVGIAPQFPITNDGEAFSATKDPVVEAALAHLRKTPESKRKAVRDN